MKQPSRDIANTLESLDRRTMMLLLGSAGVTAASGCLGFGDDSTQDPTDADDQDSRSDAAQQRPPRMGGTLRVGYPHESISPDPSTVPKVDDEMIYSLIYEPFQRYDWHGREYNWIANSMAVTDVQETIWPDSYTEFLEAETVTDVTDDVVQVDLPRDEWVLGMVTESLDRVTPATVNPGDTVQVLKRSGAQEAIDEGRYGLKLAVSMRDGIRFHNGEELSASNIAGSYDRIGPRLDRHPSLHSFLGITTPDGQTGQKVALYAREPDARAPRNLEPPWIFPSAHHGVSPGDLTRDLREEQYMMGTGPYKITEWGAESLVLEKHEDYWVIDHGLDTFEWETPDVLPPEPAVETVEIQLIPDATARKTALEEERLDIGFDLSYDTVASFRYDTEFEEWRATSSPPVRATVLQLPVHTEAEEPLGMAAIRRAIQALIPRKTIVDEVYHGWTIPAKVPIPEAGWLGLDTEGYQDELVDAEWALEAEPDIATAATYIEEADVDIPISLTIVYDPDRDLHAQIANHVAETLEETGDFAIAIETDPTIGLLNSLSASQAQSVELDVDGSTMVMFDMSGDLDPDYYLRSLYHPDNHGHYANMFYPPDTFDWAERIDDARFSPAVVHDTAERTNRYKRLFASVIETAATLVVGYPPDPYATSPRVGRRLSSLQPQRTLSNALFAPFEGIMMYLDETEFSHYDPD